MILLYSFDSNAFAIKTSFSNEKKCNIYRVSQVTKKIPHPHVLHGQVTK